MKKYSSAAWASIPGVVFPKEKADRIREKRPKSLLNRPDGYIDEKEAKERYAAFWRLLREEAKAGNISQVTYWKKAHSRWRETRALNEEQIKEVILAFGRDDWSLPDGAIREIDAADLLGIKPEYLYRICTKKGIARMIKAVNRAKGTTTRYYMESDIIQLQKERYASPYRK